MESIVQVFNSSLAIVMLPIGALGIDNTDNTVRTLSKRIIILFICLFGAMIYWSYCAILVSLLSVSDSRLAINSLEDMLGHKEYTLYILSGTVGYDYFSLATKNTNHLAYEIFEEYFHKKGI